MTESTPLKANDASCSSLSGSNRLTVDTSIEDIEPLQNEPNPQNTSDGAAHCHEGVALSDWDSTKTYLVWLLICFSTGPCAAMMRSYVPAVIQTTAHALGHPKDSSGPCLPKGDDCYVNFGWGSVQYTSYSLYLKAIYTSVEGLIAIVLMAFADYSNNRKWLMIAATTSYGIFSIPFYWLSDDQKFRTLVLQSVLYCLMLCVSTVYQITESSYIPVFMNARHCSLLQDNKRKGSGGMSRGVNVSTWGLVVGNIGGIIASLVGVIITQTTADPTNKDFLLAVTIAGVVTTTISLICANLVPNLKGKEFKNEVGTTMVLMPIMRFKAIFLDLLEYREALKFCGAWVLWNVAYSNFLSVFGLLFRSTIGIGSSDAEFTVWQFFNLLVACLGPLGWMTFYSRFTNDKSCSFSIGVMKKSLYCMLAAGTFINFWGCLGVKHNSTIGFKSRWEFWLFQALIVGSSSGIRTINRVVYSAMLPSGTENQYFGFEIMLGLCTGWCETLVVALLQDKTGNSRIPFIPNTLLYMAVVLLLYTVDLEKGMKKAEKWN
ncbi:unnamed protein product [Kluyveromyces dobzhanskii CBS 2104]|uniref:Autophagy-related protein n=1 Tax=Kluyveromyces dobzhanskii CBS 2104 TaxID=1427455 RepID=A0A0A8LA67_9SACH|nr:unnamed protein product [Kluyveromyces dobzhanskii CBS 2104]